MINFDNYANENKTEDNLKWAYIPNHPYLILTGKANALLNLIHSQPYIDETYLYAKDPYEAKYQCLINKSEGTGLKRFIRLKFSLNTQMICKMFIKILMNTIFVRNY